MCDLTSIKNHNDFLDKAVGEVISWICQVGRVRQAEPFELAIRDGILEVKTSKATKSVCLDLLTGVEKHMESIMSMVYIKLTSNGFIIHDSDSKVAADAIHTKSVESDPQQHKNTVPRPNTPSDLFLAVKLTLEQKQRVQAELPDADLFLLSCFDKDMLAACGLKPVQIQAWVRITKKLFP